MTEAIIGALATVLAALVGGFFVFDRPGRRRKELVELADLRDRSDGSLRAAIESVMFAKWVRLLSRKNRTNAALAAMLIIALLVVGTTITTSVFNLKARNAESQAASIQDASDTIFDQSDMDASNAASVVAGLLSIKSSLSPSALKALTAATATMKRATAELVSGDRESQRADRFERTAGSDLAIARDFIEVTLTLITLGAIAFGTFVFIGRRERQTVAITLGLIDRSPVSSDDGQMHQQAQPGPDEQYGDRSTVSS